MNCKEQHEQIVLTRAEMYTYVLTDQLLQQKQLNVQKIDKFLFSG